MGSSAEFCSSFQPPRPDRDCGHAQAAFEHVLLAAGPLTEAALLCNVALRCPRKIQWDAKQLKAPNCPEAEKFLRREYREGWRL